MLKEKVEEVISDWLWKTGLWLGYGIRWLGNHCLDWGWGLSDYAARKFYSKTKEGKTPVQYVRNTRHG